MVSLICEKLSFVRNQVEITKLVSDQGHCSPAEQTMSSLIRDKPSFVRNPEKIVCIPPGQPLRN